MDKLLCKGCLRPHLEGQEIAMDHYEYVRPNNYGTFLSIALLMVVVATIVDGDNLV